MSRSWIRRPGGAATRERSSRRSGPATPRCSTTRRSSRTRRNRRGSWAGCGRWCGRTARCSSRRLGLAVVVSVLQMVLPVFTQIVVDRVLVEQDLSLLHLMIVGHGRHDGVHRGVAPAAALSAELLGGADRCRVARLPDAAAARAADVVFRVAPHRRFAAASRRDPAGPRLSGAERHRRSHRRRAARRHRRPDGGLQPLAHPGLPRHRAALRAADGDGVEAAAPDLPRPRGFVQQVPLVSDRRDQGHRDRQGARRRVGVPAAPAQSVPGRRRQDLQAPTSR